MTVTAWSSRVRVVDEDHEIFTSLESEARKTLLKAVVHCGKGRGSPVLL